MQLRIGSGHAWSYVPFAGVTTLDAGRRWQPVEVASDDLPAGVTALEGVEVVDGTRFCAGIERAESEERITPACATALRAMTHPFTYDRGAAVTPGARARPRA